MNLKNKRFDTKLIHAGEPRPEPGDPVTLPIYQSSTYAFSNASEYDSVRYIRLNNTPNHLCVGQKIAESEGAPAGIVTASGMAAISTTLLAILDEGEHLLAQDSLYGGTFHFLKENFPNLGRKVSFFPLEHLDRLDEYVTPETKAIYVESVSNPLMKIPDLPGIAAFAKKRNLVSIIDNTFPSPVNFNPYPMGYQLVIHSATKYLNGHTDIAAGCVVGSEAHIRRITHLLNHLGASLDPHACYLLNRGLKTLSLRVKWQSETALKMARRLESHPKVERVLYPGLTSHPDHERAKEWFRGFGGMFSFEYHGSVEETDAFIGRLEIPTSAPSLGGVETLVTRPVTTSHSGVSLADREKLGIGDTLVRVSVGLEDPEDLIFDFLQALGGP